MRDWLLANSFFAGLPVLAGVLLLAGWVVFAKLLHLDEETLRTAIGCWAVCTLIITGYFAKRFLLYAQKR